MKRHVAASESLERLEMLYLTAGQIARHVREPVPVIMKLAIGVANRENLAVDDVLRDWLAATLH